MKIIDAHVHIFSPQTIRDREKIAGRDGNFACIYGNPKARMADREAIMTYMAEEGVERSIVCGFPFKDPGLLAEANNYILGAARRHESLIPFPAVNIADRGASIREAERCLASGARGIGEIASYDRAFGRQDWENLGILAGALEATGSPLLIHMNEQVGHEYSGKASINFRQAAEFVVAHGEATVVFAHLGGGLCFYEFMPEIRAAFRKVFYDSAATPLLYSKDVYRYLEAFLQDKVFFGSDFPLLSLRSYMPHMEDIGTGTRVKLLGGNAERFLANNGLG
jgi:predicted TIM-barrel fold metal-dependent hydrolase